MNRLTRQAAKRVTSARRPSPTAQAPRTQHASQTPASSLSSAPVKALAIGYLGVVNVGSYGLFYYDKQQALQHRWRVPEKTLQLSAALGGWVGGMLAMEHFRHKTRKEPFRTLYFLCVGANVLVGSFLLRRPILQLWGRR